MKPVAVGIFCKTPAPGFSKTRLSPPLRPEDCSRLSACFIRDLSRTIVEASFEKVGSGNAGAPVAIYTPAGTEPALRDLLAPGFELLLQGDGEFGARLLLATTQLLAAGHAGVILVNSDSPTLPVRLLRDAIAAITNRDAIVLGPAIDGGYTLIGMSRLHARMFADMPWSTDAVYRTSLQRAAEIGVPMVELPTWYDVDDEATLRILEAEFDGQRPACAEAGLVGAPAQATRAFLQQHLMRKTGG